jgi:hypothetical protein
VGPTCQTPSPLWARAWDPSISTLPRPSLRLTPTTALFGPAPVARHDVGGGAPVSPIRWSEPYHPPRATAPRTVPTTTSLRPLRCRPRPPRSAPTRPPSCTALERCPRWAADVEVGTTSMGGSHGGRDGLDERNHGGEDGFDGRRPRGRAQRTRWVASVVTSMRRGQAAWAPRGQAQRTRWVASVVISMRRGQAAGAPRWRPRCGAGEQHRVPRHHAVRAPRR